MSGREINFPSLPRNDTPPPGPYYALCSVAKSPEVMDPLPTHRQTRFRGGGHAHGGGRGGLVAAARARRTFRFNVVLHARRQRLRLIDLPAWKILAHKPARNQTRRHSGWRLLGRAPSARLRRHASRYEEKSDITVLRRGVSFVPCAVCAAIAPIPMPASCRNTSATRQRKRWLKAPNSSWLVGLDLLMIKQKAHARIGWVGPGPGRVTLRMFASCSSTRRRSLGGRAVTLR
jgi:hypothetical protein